MITPQSIYIDRDSLVHRYSATNKLLILTIFLLTITLIPKGVWVMVFFLWLLLLILILLSKIDMIFLMKRALIIEAPFIFTALPLVFISQDDIFAEIHFFRTTLLLSYSGSIRFLFLLLTSWVSIQAAVFFMATTRFEDLIRALGQLKIPASMTSILGLMWRYLFVLLEEAQNLLIARRSRSSSPTGKMNGGTFGWRFKIIGSMAGHLFIRSLSRSDRIYQAMISRGYDMNRDRNPNDLTLGIRWIDIFFVIIAALVIIVISGKIQ